MKLTEVTEQDPKKRLRPLLLDLTRVAHGDFEELAPRRGEIQRFKLVTKDGGVVIISLPAVSIAISNLLSKPTEAKVEVVGSGKFLEELYQFLSHRYDVTVDVDNLHPKKVNVIAVKLP